jgi:hypothetical protein
MKPRKWVIVVFCFILIAVLGLFEGVRSIEKGRHLERLLTERLSAASGGEVTVERVRLGFFSIYLQNVKASLSMHAYSLTIRDIKISFSLVKLLSTHGDFTKSISKIILLSPALDVRIFAPSPSPAVVATPVESAKLLAAFRSLPVDFLFVRKGTVALSDGHGESGIVLGEDLSGRLWEDAGGVSLDLRGKMASRRNNMALTAAFSRSGRGHRVSLRLDKAEIGKPLRLGRAQIVSGVLDGVVELSFPDSVTAATFESNGWVRIFRGSCTIDGVDSPVTSIGLYATLANTTLRFDSLRCAMSGLEFSGKGDWDFAFAPAAQTGLTIRCLGIRPQQFAWVPSGITKNISGQGWMEMNLIKQKNTGNRRFSFQAGGISVAGQPIPQVGCAGRWEGSQVTADSFAVSGPGFTGRGSGIVNYEKPPVAYAFSYQCRLDSLRSAKALHGQISLIGSVHGLGTNYVADAVLNSRSLAYDDITLGSPEIKLSLSSGRPLLFSSSPANAGFITVMGMVDSLGATRSPLVTCNAVFGTSTIRSLARRLMPVTEGQIDSAWARASFKGTQSAFSVNGVVGVSMAVGTGIPRVHGSVGVQVDKNEKEPGVRWQLFPQGLSVSTTAVALRGQGSFSGDSLSVDSLSVLTGVRASGSVWFGATAAGGPALLMTVACRDVPLVQLNSLGFGNRFPVRGGSINGTVRISGPVSHLRSDSDMHLRGVSLGFMTNLETDIVCFTRDTVFTIMPTVVRHNARTLISLDSITNRNGLSFSGIFQDVEIGPLLKDVLPEDFLKEDHTLAGSVSGRFTSASGGSVADVSLHSKRIGLDSWCLDSISASLVCDAKGISLRSLTASDSARTRLKAGGFVPWSAFSEEQPDEDTLALWASLSGDLIASTERNLSEPFHLPISGHGFGTVDLAIRGVAGNIRVTKAVAQLPRGVLRVKPYIPSDIKDFSLRVTMENAEDEDADASPENAKISVLMNGTIGRRPVTIRSTHDIPPGFEPLTVGFLDLGALLISTPKHGVDIHIPGFTEIGAISDVEFAPKAPWPEFALSGPVDKLCISGVWILRSLDITFPMLDNEETHVVFDPFPYITWNFDMRPGNRKVKYYYDTGKKRNLMRLVECYFEPVSVLSLRGRDLDKTFKIINGIRSSTGSVFFGRTFDRNIDIGLDFVPQPLPGGNGYDNRPIIWGSAESVSDTSRFDRIRLTILTRDSITGAWMEKGRFYDIHFRVGTDIEDIPGETQQKFMNEEQKHYASLPGAGNFVSSVGEQYLHRILFQNMEQRLAKTLGLDVITIETSIASNYFNKLYNRQFELNRWDYLALANVGITMGRYILNDKVFLKGRTELVPIDTGLQPQYDIGFEFQPLQYLLMDIDYGIHVGEKTLEYNPQLNLELRLPIKDIRKYFDF